MRVTSMAIALAATLALPTLATAQSGFPAKPYPRTDAGPPAGAYTAQGQVENRGPRVTTGEANYGGRAGPAPTRTYHRNRHRHRMMER